jgi:HsdR family type I site-specific deoxyribonuclease
VHKVPVKEVVKRIRRSGAGQRVRGHSVDALQKNKTPLSGKATMTVAMSKEQEIEQLLIEKLQGLKYTYRPDIRNLTALEQNFRQKFQELNRVQLTDAEFARLLGEIVSPDVFACSQRLRNRNTFEREDGTPLHYQLVNIEHWCKNSFEVIHQLRINTRSSFQRYDVILLVNGLPLVQIELKTLKISPRSALQQIIEYKHGAGNGYNNTLLCFMQLFIVSNRSDTLYFANNNPEHFAFDADEQFLPIYQWATPENKKVSHLDDFAEAFLAKCTLAEMISRYMVLIQSERKLMMMRPYQIYAVKAIVDCIHQNRGNGYIWHTTGSGKTLTSFKASTLLKDNPDVEKVLFVVDRKDLDRQTREEFNRFQPGCVEENTNTETLVNRLLSNDYADKVIVTTIQKLGIALDSATRRDYRKRLEALRDKRVVFIFDECHRSQFGENHRAIREFFPKSQLFGFTGTPIFEQNATYKTIEGTEARMVTTADVFSKQLHAYTITHAIDDKNVLRFRVDYFKPKGAPVKPGETLAKQKVVEAILESHDKVTNNRRFNALLATASIDDAIEYYQLFKDIQAKRQAEDENYMALQVACVFSPPGDVSPDIAQLQQDLPQELADNKKEPGRKKLALRQIILDYNDRYGTNFDLETFDLYYKDIQQRIKDQKHPNRDLPREKKIDVTIVVDMLLTGFDSQFLNTLYVDKNLKYHTTYNLARMNMLLHGLKDTEFEIFHGDSLTNEWPLLREENPAKKIEFDAVVANPPFSYRWDPNEELAANFRFKDYGLAPKSAADFAFLLHGFHFLHREGTMAIILPHGVLFRGNVEAKIRKKLLLDRNIDTVIGLAPNLFYFTGIPVCILVLKKCKKFDDVLFINAAELYEKGKKQNVLLPEHIEKIVETYQFRREVQEKLPSGLLFASRRVSMQEIEENDFNLNITRYVSVAQDLEEIDLAQVHRQLQELSAQSDSAKKRHSAFLKELGLPTLP